MGGFFLAIIVGVPLATAVVYSPVLRRLIYPPILMLQSVPKVAIVPILLLWVGMFSACRQRAANTQPEDLANLPGPTRA